MSYMKKLPVKTTGCCPKCGRAMDDHDGLVVGKPVCPKKKEP